MALYSGSHCSVVLVHLAGPSLHKEFLHGDVLLLELLGMYSLPVHGCIKAVPSVLLAAFQEFWGFILASISPPKNRLICRRCQQPGSSRKKQNTGLRANDLSIFTDSTQVKAKEQFKSKHVCTSVDAFLGGFPLGVAVIVNGSLNSLPVLLHTGFQERKWWADDVAKNANA
jgi:hypothetical protein